MAAGIDFIKNARAQEHLRSTLFAPETVRTIHSGGRALVPGRARGVTLGGCLCLLASELGPAYARPGARGGLLCLEDVGEETYRLDRYLTQLLRADWLDGVRGVLLGSWTGANRTRGCARCSWTGSGDSACPSSRSSDSATAKGR